jgi:hypothetical protein
LRGALQQSFALAFSTHVFEAGGRGRVGKAKTLWFVGFPCLLDFVSFCVIFFCVFNLLVQKLVFSSSYPYVKHICVPYIVLLPLA